MTVSDTVIVSAFTAAYAGMCGIIRVMWCKMAADHQELKRRCDNCEAKHEAAEKLIRELTGDSELLQRCPSRECPMRLFEQDGTPVPTRIIARAAHALPLLYLMWCAHHC